MVCHGCYNDALTIEVCHRNLLILGGPQLCGKSSCSRTDPQAAKAATAVAPRKEPRSEPVVNALPVGRIDLKKAEEERKAAEEPVATKKNQGNLGEDF